MSQDLVLKFFQTMVQDVSENAPVDVHIHIDLCQSLDFFNTTSNCLVSNIKNLG